jgi:hypothetical protein
MKVSIHQMSRTSRSRKLALAAVAAIRVRRFTLRSALVGMSVCAALLGMVVAL